MCDTVPPSGGRGLAMVNGRSGTIEAASTVEAWPSRIRLRGVVVADGRPGDHLMGTAEATARVSLDVEAARGASLSIEVSMNLAVADAPCCCAQSNGIQPRRRAPPWCGNTSAAAGALCSLALRSPHDALAAEFLSPPPALDAARGASTALVLIEILCGKTRQQQLAHVSTCATPPPTSRHEASAASVRATMSYSLGPIWMKRRMSQKRQLVGACLVVDDPRPTTNRSPVVRQVYEVDALDLRPFLTSRQGYARP